MNIRVENALSFFISSTRFGTEETCSTGQGVFQEHARRM